MRDHYRGAAALAYDRRWRAFTDHMLDPVVARAAPGLRAGDAVFDAGCGTGDLLARLARSVPGITLAGGDASPAMIAQARTRLGDAARLAVFDLQADEWPAEFAGPFAAVTCTSALHYLRDCPRIVARLAERIAPGGTLILADFTRHGWWWAGFEVALRALDRQHRQTLAPGDLAGFLRAAGLAVSAALTYPAGGPWRGTLAQAIKP